MEAILNRRLIRHGESNPPTRNRVGQSGCVSNTGSVHRRGATIGRLQIALALAFFAALASFPHAGDRVLASSKPSLVLTSRVSGERAVELVTQVLLRHKSACHFRIRSVSVWSRIRRGWEVASRLRIRRHRETARWNVVRTRVTPADPLAAEIVGNCP